MEWARDFYHKQNAWSGCATGPITDQHRQIAASVADFAGPGVKRILELGAGGGQVSAALAELGHHVTAIEFVASRSSHAQKLAQAPMAGTMTVVEDDFYAVTLDGHFDVVGYWDGFGIGSDEEQRRLLRRITGWLTPAGCALIEVATPWYPASVAGRGWEVGDAERRYSFDGDGCRWEDSWWPKGQPEQAVRQSTRCYSPADLRLLLESTGLRLQHLKPGGAMDWEQGKWLPSVPIGRAMAYIAQLVLEVAE